MEHHVFMTSVLPIMLRYLEFLVRLFGNWNQHFVGIRPWISASLSPAARDSNDRCGFESADLHSQHLCQRDPAHKSWLNRS